MKSLKGKIISIIVVLVIVSSLSTAAIGLIRALNVTENIIKAQFEDKLTAAYNMLVIYLNEQFGTLSIDSDGQMVDKQGNPINGKNEYMDELSRAMDIVATVFVKTGNDYTRILTTVQDHKGERVIGTVLDPKGKAYEEVSKGNDYFGEAEILGKQYITKYAPIFDANKKVIGIYFVGVHIESVEMILNEGIQTIIKSVALLIFFVLLIASIISYFVGTSIAKPIKVITSRINKQANLDFRFDEKSEALKYIYRKDEIGIMTNALNTMEDNVREFIIKTSSVAENVAATSEELTATSEQTAIASEEVAKTIEEIARGASDQAADTEVSVLSVDKMGGLLQQNTKYTKELNNIAKDIERQKEEGFSILKELIEETKKSSHAANTIHEIIINNNKNAEKIESASAMIQSIAEQTNLLALNAAIEAARAGDAGRGFAVVAEEIRKLAEQSNNFTEEIKKVIEGLKTKSQEAVDEMNEVKQIVDSQGKSVKQTEEKFEIIASSIERTNSVIEELNESVNMMLDHKNKLVDVTQNLASIAEENAAGTQQASASVEEQSASMQEIANASEGLAQIAQELQSIVANFKF